MQRPTFDRSFRLDLAPLQNLYELQGSKLREIEDIDLNIQVEMSTKNRRKTIDYLKLQRDIALEEIANIAQILLEYDKFEGLMQRVPIIYSNLSKSNEKMEKLRRRYKSIP